MGLVRVRGKACVDHPVSSPVSHTPCCLFKVEIDQWKVEKGSGSWKHLRTDVDGPDFFFLDDSTGKVLIQGKSAELDLPQSCERVVDSARRSSAAVAVGATDDDLLHYVEYSGVHKITSTIEHLLQRTGPLADTGRENARQTLLQGLQAAPMLARGETPPLDLIEKFMAARPALADPAKEAMRQAAIAHFREMAAANQLPAELANMGVKQASGRYRLREYVIVPGQEYSVTGSCTENPDCQGSHDRNLICQGTNEKTFLISARTDADEDQSLRRRSMKMVLGGAGLSLACLAMLLLHFHLL